MKTPEVLELHSVYAAAPFLAGTVTSRGTLTLKQHFTEHVWDYSVFVINVCKRLHIHGRTAGCDIGTVSLK